MDSQTHTLPKKPPTHYGATKYPKKPARCPTETSIDMRPLQKKQCPLQAHQLSQSITALPDVDHYSSYATLPSATGPERTPVGHRHIGAGKWYPTTQDQCCYLYNVQQGSQYPVCTCGNLYERSEVLPARHENQKRLGNGRYYAYDHGNPLTDEEDSAFPAFPEREFRLLHRNIPALRRTGVDISGIRQYFYPDGGWGWIICGVAFLVHILTTGLQLSYGLLLFYGIQHFHITSGIEWLGALSWAISMLVTPFAVTLCRRKSTRLLAIVGGLILPLGVLFTSFATELDQITFSYGIVVGVGSAMVREASTIMLGNYFKKRRKFVEMVAMSGEGVGIALFSVILKEGVGKAGWRLGLQIVAALVAISFFMGLLYRPASLYHPQRRAIQHLKNQRKKVRENKLLSHLTEDTATNKTYFFLDISTLKSPTVKVLVMTSGVAALGIYTPIFLMLLNAAKEGADVQELVLLQTFVGIATTMGVVTSGGLARRPFHIGRFTVTSQVLCQVFISIVAISILFMSFVMGYKGLCILSWIYGVGFGGFRYTLKILALERVKLRNFSKAWGLIRGIESIPVLISVPLTSFLNDYSLKYGRAGYYICSAAAAIAGIIIFFISYSNLQQNSSSAHRNHENGSINTPGLATHQWKTYLHSTPQNTDYLYSGCAYPATDLLNRSCISLNQVENRTTYCKFNCGRLRMQCYKQAPYDPTKQQSGSRYWRAGETEAARQMPQYQHGQGSIGSRSGKQMQKSLSFIQNPYCYDGQWYCNCHNSHSSFYKDARSTEMTQPLLCTCSPTSYMNNSRSRSVPEGLSSISQHCTCKSLPSREILYIPKTSAQHQHEQEQHEQQKQQQQHAPTCQHHTKKVVVHHMPRHRMQRSQSLPRASHFVEQITTSV